MQPSLEVAARQAVDVVVHFLNRLPMEDTLNVSGQVNGMIQDDIDLRLAEPALSVHALGMTIQRKDPGQARPQTGGKPRTVAEHLNAIAVTNDTLRQEVEDARVEGNLAVRFEPEKHLRRLKPT